MLLIKFLININYLNLITLDKHIPKSSEVVTQQIYGRI